MFSQNVSCHVQTNREGKGVFHKMSVAMFVLIWLFHNVHKKVFIT